MKLLLITSRFPYPLEKGDKLRVYHQLRILSEKHDIVLVALSDHPVQDVHYREIEQYCQRIYLFRLHTPGIIWAICKALFQFVPFQVAYFFRSSIQKRIFHIIQEEKPDHIYCQLIRMAKYLTQHSPPKTLDYMDAFSTGMLRRANLEKGLKRWFFLIEAARVKRYEKKIYPFFDHHVIISQTDGKELQSSEIPSLTIIPNGVDTQFFRAEDPQVKELHEVFFVGNMQYFPNIQAVLYLVERIMPIVWKERPHIKVLIAGANPEPEVVALNRMENVQVTGWMDDIRAAYQSGAIFVAPLFSGSGQQNKILEAMAMEKLVITTSLVNEGIKAKPEYHLHIANDPASFASCILQVLSDRQTISEMGNNARKFVVDTYTWDRAVGKLEALFTR